MAQLGCYYFHIYYPSNLLIDKDAKFHFLFEGTTFSTIIYGHGKSLLVNDFDNRIVEEEGVSNFQPEKKDITVGKGALTAMFEGQPAHPGFVLDISKHKYKELYYKDFTEVVIHFETDGAKDNMSLALKALNHFIQAYRIVSNDVLTLPIDKMTYITRVYKEYFHEYTEDEIQLSTTKRQRASRALNLAVKQVMLPFWNTQGKIYQTDPTQNTQGLADFLAKEKKQEPIADYILKAREELYIHNNYKYAFLEVWTAVEVSIVSYLRNIKLQKGISKTKLDNFESNIGISYLLNIELALIYEKGIDENFRILIGKIDAIRKLRNDVIHKNQNITEKQAIDALHNALEFFKFLGLKKIRKQ